MLIYVLYIVKILLIYVLYIVKILLVYVLYMVKLLLIYVLYLVKILLIYVIYCSKPKKVEKGIGYADLKMEKRKRFSKLSNYVKLLKGALFHHMQKKQKDACQCANQC